MPKRADGCSLNNTNDTRNNFQRRFTYTEQFAILLAENAICCICTLKILGNRNLSRKTVLDCETAAENSEVVQQRSWKGLSDCTDLRS